MRIEGKRRQQQGKFQAFLELSYQAIQMHQDNGPLPNNKFGGSVVELAPAAEEKTALGVKEKIVFISSVSSLPGIRLDKIVSSKSQCQGCPRLFPRRIYNPTRAHNR